MIKNSDHLDFVSQPQDKNSAETVDEVWECDRWKQG